MLKILLMDFTKYKKNKNYKYNNLLLINNLLFFYTNQIKILKK